jgi:hypothetical protein
MSKSYSSMSFGLALFYSIMTTCILYAILMGIGAVGSVGSVGPNGTDGATTRTRAIATFILLLIASFVFYYFYISGGIGQTGGDYKGVPDFIRRIPEEIDVGMPPF